MCECHRGGKSSANGAVELPDKMGLSRMWQDFSTPSIQKPNQTLQFLRIN